MVSAIISRLLILTCGTLYPAYASYKAIRTRNAKEYAKWMMYWVVFAFFSFVETFSDVFLSWMPFYYEIKIIFVIWMLSPMTKGSSFLFKKFVHPQLKKREKEIDEYIAQARTKGYSAILSLGHRGLKYCTNIVVKTAIKGQSTLTDHIKKSYSTNDLRVPDDASDQMDSSISYIDDDEDEIETKRDLEVISEEYSDDDNSITNDHKDARLIEDNKELERRKQKAISRSNSDITELRRGQFRAQKEAPLASLNEIEEEEFSYSEETIYYPVKENTKRDYRSDPYATLPRTRARVRGKINQ